MKKFIIKEIKYIEGWETNTYYIDAKDENEALDKVNNCEIDADDIDYNIKQSEQESIKIEERR